MSGSHLSPRVKKWDPKIQLSFSSSARPSSVLRQLHTSKDPHLNNNNNHPDSSSDTTADSIASLGDDPLAAASGQLIFGVVSKYHVVYRLVNSIHVLGVESKYRVVYRLVNSIYVLGGGSILRFVFRNFDFLAVAVFVIFDIIPPHRSRFSIFFEDFVFKFSSFFVSQCSIVDC